jgi:hypothetical protein
MLSMPLLTQGRVLFVNDAHSQAHDTGSQGTLDRPLATGAYALTRCRANSGDSVVVLAGHSESIATLSALSTVAGVTFAHLGLGVGWKTGASSSLYSANGPQQAKRAASLVTSAFDIFNVVGAVRLTDIYGLVEVVIANTASLVKLTHTPAGGVMAATDIAANSASIAQAAVGTTLSITGTLANAVVLSANQTRIAQATSVILHTGALSVASTGEPATGTISWNANYIPLTPGSYMAAA